MTPTIEFEHPADRDAELRGRAGAVRFLEVAPIRAVMIDGEGPVGETNFAARMPGLYATAYGLRFALKKRGVVRRVGMLEGLYWTVDGSTDLDEILGPNRGTWRWTLLISLPLEATEGELTAALAGGREKLAAEYAPDLRIAAFDEGPRRPGPPPRAVRRGATDDRAAPRGDRGGRPAPARSPPRAVPRRSTTVGARAAPDPGPAAGRAGLRAEPGPGCPLVAPAARSSPRPPTRRHAHAGIRSPGTARRPGSARPRGGRRPSRRARRTRSRAPGFPARGGRRRCARRVTRA